MTGKVIEAGEAEEEGEEKEQGGKGRMPFGH